MIIMWGTTNSFVVSGTKQLTPEGAKKKGSKERKGFLQKLKSPVNMIQWHLTWVHSVFEFIINVRLVLLYTATFHCFMKMIHEFLSLPAEANFVLSLRIETAYRSVNFLLYGNADLHVCYCIWERCHSCHDCYLSRFLYDMIIVLFLLINLNSSQIISSIIELFTLLKPSVHTQEY